MLTPLAIDMYLPSLPRIARDLGVSNGAVQGTVSAYVLGFGLGQLVLGPLADGLGRRPVLITGTLVFTLLAPLCAMANDVHWLQWLRIAQGASGAAASVVIYALLRDLVDDRNELSRLFSSITLVITLAPLLAPMIGGWILTFSHWQGIFWALAGFGLAASLLVWWRVPETLRQRESLALLPVLKRYRQLLMTPPMLGLMLCSGFSFGGLMAFLTAGSFVYINDYGVAESHFGYYFGLNVLALMAVTLFNGRMVYRWGPQRLLTLALSLQLGAAAMALTVVLTQGPFWLLVLGVMGYVGSLSMVGSNIMSLVLEKVPNMAGTASSLTGSLRFGIGASVGMVVATIKGADALAMTGAMLASACLASVGFWGIYRRSGETSGTQTPV